MSSFLSKIGLKTAAPPANRFDLSCDHVTTSDFFRLKPVYISEMVPGDTFKISMSTFTRLMAMQKPMYGKVRMINYCFFVPNRTIMEGWNEFFTGTPYTSPGDGGSDLITTVPYFTTTDLCACFRESLLSHAVTSSEAYDFYYTNNLEEFYFKFTREGRFAWDVLCSLGYHINLSYTADSMKFNALPLLAFVRCYTDYFANPQYPIPSLLTSFLGVDKHLTSNQLYAIFRDTYMANYNKDYFTSSNDYPTGTSTLQGTGMQIKHDDEWISASATSNIRTSVNDYPGSNNKHHAVNLQGAKMDGSASSSQAPMQITQNSLNWLHRATDYIMRLYKAGDRFWDRYEAKTGEKLPEASLNKSYLLGRQVVNIQVSDVMSTADTVDPQAGEPQGKSLGSYAGKGVGFEQSNFSYSTKEYGYIMILSIIVPNIGYVQGTMRMNLRTSKFDFYNGEFDRLGYEPIYIREVNDGQNTKDAMAYINCDQLHPNGVHGWTSRYGSYKCPRDFCSGDFMIPSLAESMETWHLFRMFPTYATDLELVHSEEFCRGEQAQYDRIFDVATDGSHDHFYTVHQFKISATRNMAKMFDDYDFDSDGRMITIETGGSML